MIDRELNQQQLDKVLRITACILFERGEKFSSVKTLLYGLVKESTLKIWYKKHRRLHGNFHDTRRIPAPPIDFEKIAISDLEELGEQKTYKEIFSECLERVQDPQEATTEDVGSDPMW
jgi:hypothetical protein